MHKSNYIIHDCETGGLDYLKNPITQYACAILDFKTLKELDRWSTFVKPYNNLAIEQKALDSTMVKMSDINAGISIKQFNKTFSMLLESHRAKVKYRDAGRLISVGHNIPFDHDFLEYALAIDKLDLFEYIHRNFIDTFPFAKLTWGLTGEEKLNLGASCGYAKIKITDAHGADNDVSATADLFRFYAKKLRAKKGEGVIEAVNARAIGSEFFEFKCGKKE